MALMLLLATVIHLSFLGKKEMCVRVIIKNMLVYQYGRILQVKRMILVLEDQRQKFFSSD